MNAGDVFADLIEIVRTGRLLGRHNERLPPLDGFILYDISYIMTEIDSLFERDGEGKRVFNYAVVASWLAADLRMPAPRVAIFSPLPDRWVCATLQPYAGDPPEGLDGTDGIEWRQYFYQRRAWRVPDRNDFIRVWPSENGISVEYPSYAPKSAYEGMALAMVGCLYACRVLADREIEYDYEPTSEKTLQINARRLRLNLPPVSRAMRILHLKDRKVIRAQGDQPLTPTGQPRGPYDFYKPTWPVTRTLSGGRVITYVAHRREDLLTRSKTKPKPWFKVIP